MKKLLILLLIIPFVFSAPDAKITTWYENKDIAFAIGVDELPVGGYDGKISNNELDTFYWYRSDNNVWTKYWKPILDQNSWVRYSLGLVPSRTSPNNLSQDIQPPDNTTKDDLTWDSPEGKKWIDETLKPILNYNNKHYDEYAAHGYWHEDWASKYYPYWHKNSTLLIEPHPYNNPFYFEQSLINLQNSFQQTFNHKALVMPTLPFGEARPDTPTLYPKNGIYAVGLWTDRKNQPTHSLTGLHEIDHFEKSYKKPIGSIIEAEGTWVDNEQSHYAKIGEMQYWYQDERYGDKNNKIIAVPYSASVENSFSDFKERISYLLDNKEDFDAPNIYYFLHVNSDFGDSLFGGKNKDKIRTWLYENDFKELSKQPLKKYILIITLISISIYALTIFSLRKARILPSKKKKIKKKTHILFIILLLLGAILTLAITTETTYKIGLQNYASNSEKHNKELQWIYENHQDNIWFTDLSTMAEYFDIRKNSQITLEDSTLTINHENIFEWDSRAIEVTVEIDKTIQGENILNKNGKSYLNIIINPKEKQTVINLQENKNL